MVVVEPRLGIEELPGHAQVEGEAAQPLRIVVRRQLPEAVRIPRPAVAVLVVLHDARGVDLVGVDEVDRRR